jgi:hypothetical protein
MKVGALCLPQYVIVHHSAAIFPGSDMLSQHGCLLLLP